MKKRLFERGLSLLLAFVMVLALAPVFTIEAEAANATAANLGQLINSTTSGTIVLTEDATLSGGTYTIKSGVTLLLPYASGANTVRNDTYKFANGQAIASTDNINYPGDGKSSAYITLTLENATLNVEGSLIVGGEYSSKAGAYSGQTAGSYSQINMDSLSSINVMGGVLSCIGYIVGGTINATENASVYEPFIINDYAGGTYTAVSFKTIKISPFLVYSVINIQSEMTLDTTSKLYGYCDLYTPSTGDHNETTALVIGNSGALFVLKNGTVTLTYDASKTAGVRKAVGQTTLSFDGDGAFGSLSMKVQNVEVNTNDVYFPLPYSFRIVQESGTFTVTEGIEFKMLPGSELLVEQGAELVVENGSKMVVYDGMSPTSTTYSVNYPTCEELSAGGYYERARLIIDGEMNINSTFAGKIETNGTGVVSVATSSLSENMIEGSAGNERYMFIYKAEKNTRREYPLVAQLQLVNQPNKWTNLTNGVTYYGISNDVWKDVTASFTYKDSSGKSYTKEYSNPEKQAGVGTWIKSTDAFVVASSYNDNGKMTDVKVGSNVVPGMGDYTLFLLDKDTYAPLCASRPLN